MRDKEIYTLIDTAFGLLRHGSLEPTADSEGNSIKVGEQDIELASKRPFSDIRNEVEENKRSKNEETDVGEMIEIKQQPVIERKTKVRKGCKKRREGDKDNTTLEQYGIRVQKESLK